MRPLFNCVNTTYLELICEVDVLLRQIHAGKCSSGAGPARLRIVTARPDSQGPHKSASGSYYQLHKFTNNLFGDVEFLGTSEDPGSST